MDVESASPRTGFSALARNMAINPKYEPFMFRKFYRRSARHLLDVEGKFAYLAWKLDRANEQAGWSRDTEALRSTRVWEALKENAKDDTRPEHARMILFDEIKSTLEDYLGSTSIKYISIANVSIEDALMRQNWIACLKCPRKRTLGGLWSQSYGQASITM
ncbi:hypothetical protein FALBO_7333 [Fusarium albosuccineum]|uniref:Uncharacterized protein n=1 Tax=Fusarium albosuccineum TaxID=1237068 RepID=A0A8H4LCW2_9HYPO|nr:hypothetical protein FALBO_7333 [Fusarium albosuccineum]